MRVLVVGAGGLVGAAVMRAAAGAGLAWTGLDRNACDVTSAAQRLAALRTIRPDAVLFCAGFTAVDAVAAHPESHAVNVAAPIAWARELPTWYLSSNFVFDGPGPHAPGAPVRPQSPYAHQKASAEAGVLNAGGHVVRVGWVYGAGGRTFASTLPGRLRAGERVQAITDVVVMPTHANDVAAALIGLPAGITHLMAREETTWFELASAVQARLGVGAVEPVRSAELGLGPRPLDGRLAPALLPGWTDRLDLLLGSPSAA